MDALRRRPVVHSVRLSQADRLRLITAEQAVALVKVRSTLLVQRADKALEIVKRELAQRYRGYNPDEPYALDARTGELRPLRRVKS